METRTNKAGFKESVIHRECTNCGDMFKRTSTNTMKICPKCNTARIKGRSNEAKMLNRAQQRAKQQSLPFNLELKDITIPDKCPVLGIALEAHSGSPGGTKCSPSLDRIEPEKGYVKGNVRVVSQLANAMKANASVEELVKFAKWVLENHTGEE